MKKNIIIFVLLGVIAVLVLTIDTNPINTNNIKQAADDATSVVTDKVESVSEEVSPKTKLNLSGQGLSKLPSYVLSVTFLEELDISNNNLAGALPAEIRFLKKLRILKADNNLMTGVPAEIGQLENLQVLDLSNNRLTGLPNELGNLKKLKVLNLSGNDYSEQDLNVIRQGLSSDVEIIL